MTDLIIIVLATWYVSYVLTSSHGPGGVFDWIREHVWHGRTIIAEREIDGKKEVAWNKNGLLDCPVCLAFWAGLALLLLPMGVVTQALAVAGAAMILHSWSGWRFVQ